MIDRSVKPEVKELREIAFPEIQKTVLDNGVEVYVYDRQDINLIRVSVVSAGGTADSKNPATALIASLMSQEGTRKMKGEEIAETIELNGGWIQSGSESHQRSINVLCLSDRWKHISETVGEILWYPTFAGELESMKSRLAAQALTNEQSVVWQASNLSNRLTFGVKHPMSQPMDSDIIKQVERREIMDFYEHYRTPENVKIFLTGKIDDSILSDLNEQFGKVNGKGVKWGGKDVIPFKPVNTAETAMTEMKEKLQSAIYSTIPVETEDIDELLDVRMAIFALGGYFGSRLEQNIREEKGLTYGISSNLLNYPEGKLMLIKTECSTSYVDRVIDEIGLELSRLGECEMGEDELVRLRRAEMTNLTEIVSTPFSIMDFYKIIVMRGLGVDYFEKRRRAALEITSARIREVAERYLSADKLITAIAGGK